MDDAQEVWTRPYFLERRSDNPEQYMAIGWINGRLFSVIFEIREDSDGHVCHLVTLWKATRREEELYEKNS